MHVKKVTSSVVYRDASEKNCHVPVRVTFISTVSPQEMALIKYSTREFLVNLKKSIFNTCIFGHPSVSYELGISRYFSQELCVVQREFYDQLKPFCHAALKPTKGVIPHIGSA